MAISSPGVGSGLDINSLITQLVAVEKQPLKGLQKNAGSIQTRISTYGKLNSLVDSLHSAAAKLTSSTLWLQSQATSSDSTSVDVTASGSAQGSSYAVKVNQLAQAQTLVTTAIPSTADLRGSLTVDIGRWQNADSTGTFTPSSPARTISIDLSAASSLESVRDAINTNGAPLRASIITDTAGKRLVITSSETGSPNGFRITTSPPAGQASYDLQQLSYPAVSLGTVGMSAATSACNAAFTVNGIAMSTESNVVDGALDGLKLTLRRVTSDAVNVSTSNDAAAQRKAIDELISAYNAVVSEVSTDTAYDPSTKTGGPLQGDSAAISIMRQLRSMLSQTNSNWGSLNSLNTIGLEFGRDGKLSVKSSAKLNDALSKPDQLAELFNNASATDSDKGLALQLRDLSSRMLNDSGLISAKTAGLQSQLKRNQSDQEKVNQRAAQVEARLRQQYTALDSLMSQSQALSNYVAQQFAPKKSN